MMRTPASRSCWDQEEEARRSRDRTSRAPRRSSSAEGGSDEALPARHREPHALDPSFALRCIFSAGYRSPATDENLGGRPRATPGCEPGRSVSSSVRRRPTRRWSLACELREVDDCEFPQANLLFIHHHHQFIRISGTSKKRKS
jgi:hypothetical protein